MKLQSLAVIFIIIILPISMVLSEYISNLIDTKEVEMEYNTKLLNSTYDAVKAYQLNTVNNAFGDVATQKVDDVEAGAETFLNSLTSSFNYSGYDSHVMQEYVPAIVFTMYDGYYIYSPFTNVLTEVQSLEDPNSTSYDKTYSEHGEIRDGLKPYVYYNCRYVQDDKDIVITYTLDNYITIQGTINGNYVYDCGYIYEINSDNGIQENGNSYIYNGITFSNTDTEELKECVGNQEYSYVKINGKKYYLEENTSEINMVNVTRLDGTTVEINKNAKIFYIDKDGKKNYSQTQGYSDEPMKGKENEEFIRYYLAIKKNKSAYEYFKRAYEFSKMVFGGGGIDHYKDKAGNEQSGYGLEDLMSDKAKTNINDDLSDDITDIIEHGSFAIFGENGKGIGHANSNFEQHRKAVIRYVIETNLTTAISSFASTASAEFTMPKISEEDWELIENDVCAISFMQGLPTGSKKYNGYAVVANTLTNEYIDEQDIYILVEDKDNTDNKFYCRPTDNELIKNGGIYSIIEKNSFTNNFYSGIWKLNFELKQDATNAEETIIYQPMCYNLGGSNKPYLGSYTSVMGTSSLNTIGTQACPDMYSYLSKIPGRDENANSLETLKTVYYMGLARERWGAYNVNNINYELYGNSNGCDYFLNSY